MGGRCNTARACQAGQVAAQVLHRCYDLSDLLAVAAAGQAEVAMVAAGTRWLDRDALARLAAAGLAVVGVVADGDEDSERRLRQLGLLHVASDADPPAALVDRARAALDAESDLADPDPTEESPDLGEAPIEPDGDGRRILAAVWGPKGGPGRTTVAVNLAFEAAAAGGEVLLVDADTYGGAVAQSIGFAEVPGGSRWSPDRSRVTRTKAALDHVAVVRVPAYAGAGVVGVRHEGGARPTLPLLTLARRRG